MSLDFSKFRFRVPQQPDLLKNPFKNLGKTIYEKKHYVN